MNQSKESRQVTYRGTIYPWHCDHVGHMNVMWYVGKFEEATWCFMTDVGLTPGLLRTEGRGMAAVKQEISDARELMASDVVMVWSCLLEIRERVIRSWHEMHNSESGDLATSADLTAVHMDTAARRAIALPDAVRRRSQTLIAQGARDGGSDGDHL